MADEASHHGPVLLLNPGPIVAAVGSGTGELNASIAAVLGEGCVDEHAVVVRVNAADREGQLFGDGLQPSHHQGLRSGQQGDGPDCSWSGQPVQTSVTTRLNMKEPPMLSPQWATRSISRKPGGGRRQSAKVRTGMLRPADRFRRRLRRPDTVVRIGWSSRSSVAALADSNRSLTSGSQSRWPWRSMDSTKWGSAAFRRLPQMRSLASQTRSPLPGPPRRRCADPGH